jgi:hypothetical protein
LFLLEPVQPARLLATRKQLFRFFRENEKKLGVALRDDLMLAALGQSFLPEVTDGLQHPHPRLVADDMHQVLVDQGLEQREISQLAIDRKIKCDRLGGVKRSATGEDRKAVEYLLLGRVEEIIAPGDGVPHGLLPRRQITRTVA